MLNEQQIEELAEQFEDQWCDQFTGPTGLKRFLQKQASAVEQEYPLLCTLASIDIELAWQTWHKSLDELVTEAPPDHSMQDKCQELLATLSVLPRIDHYLPCLHNWDRNHPTWTQLLQCEAMARAHWGDNIGESYYRNRYGTSIQLTGPLPTHTLQVSKHAPSRDVAPVLKAEIRGTIEVGRQRSQDPTGWGQTGESEVTRIIIADRKDTRISREQLKVYLLNPRLVIIQNGAKDSSDVISYGKAVLPGQYRLVQFPFIIKIIDNRLAFA